MSEWNKETQLVSMYYGEYFMEYAPFTESTIREYVTESILENQNGLSRDLLVTSLNSVDWFSLAKTYNESKETLFDEL